MRAVADTNRPARVIPRSSLAEKHGLDPFKVFCAYHLGLTDDDRYEFQNVHQVAKRFGVPSGVLKQVLQDWQLDADHIVHSTFDMSGAQVDVMYVPEGISRRAMAESLWQDFLHAAPKSRDWQRELAEDAMANEKVFGPSRAQHAASPSRDVGPRTHTRRR